MINKSPAFQFYPADYLGSQRVALMTLEEEGAYIRLLCYCWEHGSIPSDPQKISFLIGKGASTTLASKLLPMFILDSNDASKLRHVRLDKERKKQEEWREKSSKGGKTSAKNRWKKGYSKGYTGSEPPLQPPLEPPLQPNGNSSSSVCSLQFASSFESSTAKETTLAASDKKASLPASEKENFLLSAKGKKLRDKNLEWFEKFWEAFDYKKGKRNAADSWLNLGILNQETVDIIISGAKREAEIRPNLIEKGRTPIYAQGWLTGKRWEDEIIKEKTYEELCRERGM